MTIKDFLDLTSDDLSRLNEKQRRELVDEMSSKANRRLDKLDELFFVSPAMASRLDDEGKIRYFTSDDKNNNQLANELKNLQRFLGNKTSKVYGAKQSARRIYAKVMNATMAETSINDVAEAFNYSSNKMNVFWSAYNKILESNPGIISTKSNDIAGQFTSGQVQQKIYEIFSKNSNLNSDELWLKAQEFLDNEYEPPPTPGQNPFTFVHHG